MNSSNLTASDGKQPILEVRNIVKEFPGVRALDGVQLRLKSGEVCALLGENGAGKSTLVKILTGVYQPTEGEILMDGSPLSLQSAQDAWDHGITAIHQETIMFSELSVAENIFMGHHLTGKFNLVNWQEMYDQTAKLLGRLGITDFDPQTPIKELSVAQKHLVEVAKALSHDARVLIMDEPTASLSQKEVDELFVIVRRLRDEGTAILFISHRFDDIFAISDSYVVFRDGGFVGDGLLKEAKEEDLIKMMAGREVKASENTRTTISDEVVLQVDELCHETEFENISFSLHRGEILGFYGLVGSGRSELMHAIFGLTKPVSGQMNFEGNAFAPNNPEDAIINGLVYVPEDRQHCGAILDMSIRDNITLPSLQSITGSLKLNRKKEASFARNYASRLKVKAHSLAQKVVELSGGNQQKVVIGKWLGTGPKVIILDEPTKGIDVGAKAMVHQFINELVESGLSVIIVSSELPEVLGLSDRIVVMREGLMRATLNARETSQEEIVAFATGLK